jgi:pimeloyl-ACP methyl ester carboxylesterase
MAAPAMTTVLLVIVVLVAGIVALDLLMPQVMAPLLLRLEQRRCRLAAGRVRVDDVEMAYLEGGSGEPLILVHGFGATKDNFTRVAAYLTPHYRVLIPDLPGFGDSSKAETASYSIGQQVEWLHGFATALGVGRVHLGGSSMGGFIATLYALTHPDDVGSLWLLAPAGTEAAFDSELARRISETGENMLVASTPEAFGRTMDFVLTRKPFMPYSVKRVMGKQAAVNFKLHSRIFEEIGPPKEPGLEHRLQEVTAPALVVWGTQDRVLSPAAAERYRTAMPNAQVIRMEGIGHLPMVEAPAPAAADYLQFRARIASARSSGARGAVGASG